MVDLHPTDYELRLGILQHGQHARAGDQRAALDLFRLETRTGDPILLTGAANWSERLIELPEGDHTLRWLFVRDAASTDVVLLAGKGHEETQEIAGVKTPFSDVDQAVAALAQRGDA